MALDLTPERALIFRIVHRDNVSRILDTGLRCCNSRQADPNYVNIGNVDLIGKRHNRSVRCGPRGVFDDYVPFYFTPYSIMLFNTKTGYNVQKRAMDEIVIFVSSLRKLQENGRKLVFTDRHAFVALARFFDDLDNLSEIDWPILRNRDFKYDSNDPGKKERYMAEAMVHRQVPIDCLLGIACYDSATQKTVQGHVERRAIELPVRVQSGLYFR